MQASPIGPGVVVVPDWLPRKVLSDVDAVDGVSERSTVPGRLLPGHRTNLGQSKFRRKVRDCTEPRPSGGVEVTGKSEHAVWPRPFHRRGVPRGISIGIINKHGGEDGAPALHELNAPSVFIGIPPQIALIIREGGCPYRAHETHHGTQHYGQSKANGFH